MLQKNVDSFILLGELLQQDSTKKQLEEVIQSQFQKNSWFIPTFSRNAVSAISHMLNKEDMLRMANHYWHKENLNFHKNLTIAVISAGNIPMAGFLDFMMVLLSGNHYMGKLSSQDNMLLPAIADLLISIDADLANKITFVEKVSDFDKIIVTGSNNSARYFEYYFGKYPHILRKNRNGVAVLSGKETIKQLTALCDDCFLYFGLGCRSISKILIPRNYDFQLLIQAVSQYPVIGDHHHYLNNLEYQKAIFLINQLPFVDAGNAIFIENKNLSSPISVIYYQYYDNFETVTQYLENEKDHIQCVVGEGVPVARLIPFGQAQYPFVTDYPDDVDLMEFLGA